MGKLRSEPCWKRLLKSKTQHSWLKKDQDRWYTDECQRAKEQWREAYFTAKNNGEDPSKGKKTEAEKKSDEDNGQGPDTERKKDLEQWENKLKEFRARAVPRKSAEKTKKQASK